MIRRHLALMVVAAALGSPPALAQAPPLRLPEVLASVEQRYPPVLAGRRAIGVAAGDLLSAQGGFDPRWRTGGEVVPSGEYANTRIESRIEQATTLWGTKLYAGYRLGAGDFAPYDGKSATNSLGELQAGVTVPLWRNGAIDKRRAELTKTELGLLLAAAELDKKRLESNFQAAGKYWDWIAAGRKLALSRQQLALAEQRDRDLARSISLGALPAVERLDNRRAIQQRQAKLVEAERYLQKSAIELSLYWRCDDGKPVVPAPQRLPADLPEPADWQGDRLSGDLEAALVLRPELRALAALRAQKQVTAALAGNQMAPAVDLNIVGSQDAGDGPIKRGIPEVRASMSVDMPVLNREWSGQVQSAEAAIAKLDIEIGFAQDQVRAEVMDAHSAVTMTLQRLEAVRAELQTAQTLEEAERTKFRLGDSSMFLVNLREQGTYDAALRAVEALADYHKAVAQLGAATAVGLDVQPADRHPVPERGGLGYR